jgi:Leucine-rich repeat (LRR) protein
LKKLDLSNCKIESLVFVAFAGLAKLERVNLYENRLQNIEYPDKILLPSLHDLNWLNSPGGVTVI